MQTKNVTFDARAVKTSTVIALVFSLVGFIFAPSPAARDRAGVGIVPQRANKVSKISFSVQNPRPLAEAILRLESEYGWVITYEDPRYAYAGDLEDVTERVSTNLDQYPKSRAPRVVFPKGGALTFQYSTDEKTSPLDSAAVVQQLLVAQAASTNAGRFRMERDGQMIHVIPTAVKDSSGRLRRNKSVLDALITLPREERSALKTLDAFCSAIGKATQMRIMPGTIPLNLFYRRKIQVGATGQVARAVLVRLLDKTGNGTKLSWRLLYDPRDKAYMLNIRVIS